MKEITTKSWDDFWETLNNLQDKSGKEYYFRGQEDSEWGLKTTLERATDKTFSVQSYLNKCIGASKIIESHYETGFDLPDSTEVYKKRREDIESLGSYFVEMPGYDYLVFLRHHGFPSPLLDWTRSIYIAAFFAFFKVNTEETESISIYAYSKNDLDSNTNFDKKSQIYRLGKYFKTHPRHFLQQADYTIAVDYRDPHKNIDDFTTSDHYFVSHDEITQKSSVNCWKFNIPSQ